MKQYIPALSVNFRFSMHFNKSKTRYTLPGFITTIVMEKVLGASGSYLLLMIVFMALMATGSGEVMAISSILVYDIYKTYIGPFRLLTVYC